MKDKAFRYIDNVLQLDSNYIYGLHIKSLVLLKEKELDLSLEICDKILEINNQYGPTYFTISRIEALRNNTYKAIENLRIALNYYPNLKNEIDVNEFEKIRELEEFRNLIESY